MQTPQTPQTPQTWAGVLAQAQVQSRLDKVREDFLAAALTLAATPGAGPRLQDAAWSHFQAAADVYRKEVEAR